MKRTQIYLEERQAAALDERAAANGTTRSELIRAAIDSYMAETDDTEAARLASFRAAVDEAFGSAPRLPRGEDYVSELRVADAQRDLDLERRWRR